MSESLVAARRPVIYCLCCACGTITLERCWTYWQAKDDWDDEADKWRPSELGESDGMARCPGCFWEHVDDDSNPGLYQGTLDEMYAERKLEETDFAEWWAHRLAEIEEPDA